MRHYNLFNSDLTKTIVARKQSKAIYRFYLECISVRLVLSFAELKICFELSKRPQNTSLQPVTHYALLRLRDNKGLAG